MWLTVPTGNLILRVCTNSSVQIHCPCFYLVSYKSFWKSKYRYRQIQIPFSLTLKNTATAPIKEVCENWRRQTVHNFHGWGTNFCLLLVSGSLFPCTQILTCTVVNLWRKVLCGLLQGWEICCGHLSPILHCPALSITHSLIFIVGKTLATLSTII